MKLIIKLLFVFILSFPTFGEEIAIKSYVSSNTKRFVENRGQYIDSTGEVARDVLYLADIPGGRLYVRRSGISLVSIEKKYAPSEDKDAAKDKLRPYPALLEASSARVDIEFLNTSPEIQFLQSEGSSEYLNYYLPHCKLTGVPVYESVLLKGVYMGIDLRVYQGPEGQPEYDFIINTGADPDDIVMQVRYADETRLDDNGDLIFSCGGKSFVNSRPISYQGETTIISGYELTGSIVKIKTEEYDRSQALIIDPMARLWGTYYGGLGRDSFKGVDVDDYCNVYMSGGTTTDTSDYVIASPGAKQVKYGGGQDEYHGDILVAKFSPEGKRLWATYIGGSGADMSFAIDTDHKGTSAITGFTGSTNGDGIFANPGAQQMDNGGGDNTWGYFGPCDAFLMVLDSSGRMEWGTFYGDEGNDTGYGTVIDDRTGNIYLAGWTMSTSGIATKGTFQTKPGSINPANGGFIAKFDRTGKRIWGTYCFGATSENISSIAIDSLDGIYVCGRTYGHTGLSTPGAYKETNPEDWDEDDLFLAKFDTTGQRVWSTYFGGRSHEYFEDSFSTTLATDRDNNVLFGGYTEGAIHNFIDSTSFQKDGVHDGFLAKFNSNGKLIWGTYYGGEETDVIAKIVIDNNNNIFIAGITHSTFEADSVVTKDAFQDKNHGSWDGFFAKLNSNGQRLWGSYLGAEDHDYINGIAVDHKGRVIVAGQTLSMTSDYISSHNGHQIERSGGFDAFSASFQDITTLTTVAGSEFCAGSQVSIQIEPKISLKPDNEYIIELSDEYGNFNVPVVLGKYRSNTGSTMQFSLPDNLKESKYYRIRANTTNPKEIGVENTAPLTIHALPVPAISGKDSACSGITYKYRCQPDPKVNMMWSAEGGEITGRKDKDSVEVLWGNGAKGKLLLSHLNKATKCEGFDEFEVVINELPVVSFDKPADVCMGDSAFALTGGSPSGGAYRGKGVEGNIFDPKVSGAGIHELTYSYSNHYGCSSIAKATLTVISSPDKPVISYIDGALKSTPADQFIWYRNGMVIPDQTSNRLELTEDGTYNVVTINEKGCRSEMSEPYIFSDVKDELHSVAFSIYPNPASDYIDIQSENVILSGAKNLKIYNILGECVLTPLAFGEGSGVRLDISALSPGLYIIRALLPSGEVLQNSFVLSR